MTHEIRPFRPDDLDRCVEFGLKAFGPVFAGFEKHYGKALFDALRPDWEQAQSQYMREACSSEDNETWVATVDGEPGGFVVLVADPNTSLGQIELLAVAPDQQRKGVGTALNEFGVKRLQELGMSFVVVATGTDPGHAPARRSYEKAGFAAMSIQPLLMVKDIRG